MNFRSLAFFCAVPLLAASLRSEPIPWDADATDASSSPDVPALVSGVTLFALPAETRAVWSTGGSRTDGAKVSATGAAPLRSSSSENSERVLWFSVDGNASVSDGSGQSSTVAGYDDGNGNAPNAVRIRVSGEGVGEGEFLDLYYYYDGAWLTDSGLDTVGLDGQGSVGWQPARLPAALDSGVSLEMQLGAYSEADETFTVLATSSQSLASLVAGGAVSSGGFSTQPQRPWSPPAFTAVAVPEPATLFAGLLGAAILLRRRA